MTAPAGRGTPLRSPRRAARRECPAVGPREVVGRDNLTAMAVAGGQNRPVASAQVVKVQQPTHLRPPVLAGDEDDPPSADLVHDGPEQLPDERRLYRLQCAIRASVGFVPPEWVDVPPRVAAVPVASAIGLKRWNEPPRHRPEGRARSVPPTEDFPSVQDATGPTPASHRGALVDPQASVPRPRSSAPASPPRPSPVAPVQRPQGRQSWSQRTANGRR